MHMKYLVICDIDGTINAMGQSFNYDRAETIEPMAYARESLELFKEHGAKIIYLTGRGEHSMKEMTERWLQEHQFPEASSVIYFNSQHGPWTWQNYKAFKMRETRSIQESSPGYTVIFLDDNTDVVQEAGAAGHHAHLIRTGDDWVHLCKLYLKLVPEGRYPGGIQSSLLEFTR